MLVSFHSNSKFDRGTTAWATLSGNLGSSRRAVLPNQPVKEGATVVRLCVGQAPKASPACRAPTERLYFELLPRSC
jgi:hypothetical protein